MKAPFTHIVTALLTGLLAGLLAVAITACGGSSSSVTAPPVDTTPVPPGTAPSITTQPVKLSVVAGKTATFSVVAAGSSLTYQWKKNGADISGATSSTYAIPATTSADSGDYSVVVTNSAGTVTSAAASLTVTAQAVAPAFTTQPFAQPVTAGQTATFSVEATGTSPLRYQWKKNGTNIDGATISSYTTPATLLTDNGTEYSVEVSNEAGNATSSIGILTVTAAPVAPSFTTQPAAKTVTVGQTASFTVEAAGTAPLRYQWKKGGTNIEGATGSSYTTPATELADSDAKYSVEVSNDVGTVTSEVVILTVTMGPVITKEPAALTVTAGQTAAFSVEATGTPAPTYQWQKNGADIPGATSNTYTTPATTGSDNAAVFKVVVTNSAGTATSKEAVLSVNVPAGISTQPMATSVFATQMASFSVTATGTEPFTYQWKKNGSDIAGATSSTYTTPATTSADIGTALAYSVVVSNSVGTVTSTSATLTVSARYSQVPNGANTYALTECVKDNSTGLVWEGKTASGSRLGTGTYTNYDSTTSLQKPGSPGVYVLPTQADLDASNNSYKYRTTVNTSPALCGFTDWRMPTKEELQGILASSGSPRIDTDWFPNTQAAAYWTSTPGADNDELAFSVYFSNGTITTGFRYVPFSVRLVRCGRVSPACTH